MSKPEHLNIYLEDRSAKQQWFYEKLIYYVMDRAGYNALELAIKAGNQSVVEVLNTKKNS